MLWNKLMRWQLNLHTLLGAKIMEKKCWYDNRIVPCVTCISNKKNVLNYHNHFPPNTKNKETQNTLQEQLLEMFHLLGKVFQCILCKIIKLVIVLFKYVQTLLLAMRYYTGFIKANWFYMIFMFFHIVYLFLSFHVSTSLFDLEKNKLFRSFGWFWWSDFLQATVASFHTSWICLFKGKCWQLWAKEVQYLSLCYFLVQQKLSISVR